jgi:RHH-type proline utilization regulon transcriptional repressor/proline dehydrogenase/delta 1-pyrroline-5-carboxylate dehydrogenase
VIQAYLKDSFQVTQRLLDWVQQRATPITIRLVRGAYWDSEVILSRQRNWPCPVYTSKPETDASFERLTDLLLEHHTQVRVAIATHNLRSIAHAIVKAEELRVPQDHWEFQVLYGMGEVIQRGVRRLGIPVRIYAPVGELIPGMAYLVRRILENTSHSSFIAMSLLEEHPPETFLEPPHAG